MLIFGFGKQGGVEKNRFRGCNNRRYITSKISIYCRGTSRDILLYICMLYVCMYGYTISTDNILYIPCQHNSILNVTNSSLVLYIKGTVMREDDT